MEDNNDDVDNTDGNGNDFNNIDENGDEDSTGRRLLAKSSQSRQGRRERLFFNCLKALSLRYVTLCYITLHCHHNKVPSSFSSPSITINGECL